MKLAPAYLPSILCAFATAFLTSCAITSKHRAPQHVDSNRATTTANSNFPKAQVDKLVLDVLQGTKAQFAVSPKERYKGDVTTDVVMAKVFHADRKAEGFTFSMFGSMWTNSAARYRAYRVSGDSRLLEDLHRWGRMSEWYFANFDRARSEAMPYNAPWYAEYVAKKKAGRNVAEDIQSLKITEGLELWRECARWLCAPIYAAHLTIEKARHEPMSVPPEQLAEAERFMKFTLKELQFLYEGEQTLEDKWGVPVPKANHPLFDVAYNQSVFFFNILAATAVTLENWQALHGSTQYDDDVKRLTMLSRAFVDAWLNQGHMCEFDGKAHFYWAYNPNSILHRAGVVNGHPVYKYPEDSGHAWCDVWGLSFFWSLGPQFGVTDDVITAATNTLRHNRETLLPVTNKRTGEKLVSFSDNIQCPVAIKHYDRGGHLPGVRPAFFLLSAFDDTFTSIINDPRAATRAFSYVAYGQYLKAQKENRGVLHLVPRE